MRSLSRQEIQRMVRGTGNASASSGGGGTTLAGYATESWVNENYLSIDFFRSLFRAYDSSSNEIVPNGDTSTIDNIKAMFGFWTEQYISALGQNSSGGGGGGATALSQLTDVALSSPTNGQALVYNATSQKWENQNIGGGGGTGTLTSIGLVMPTGFSVSPATLVADGSFTVSFDTGYGLPLTADVAKGVTAYGWGNHANAGYLTASDLTGYATQQWVTTRGYLTSVAFTDLTSHPTTLSGYGITDALGDTTTFWGRTASNGVVNGTIESGANGGEIGGFHAIELNTHGSLNGYGGLIDFHYNGASGDYTTRLIEETSGVLRIYGKLQIGSAVIEWDSTNNCLKITGNLTATGGISALG